MSTRASSRAAGAAVDRRRHAEFQGLKISGTLRFSLGRCSLRNGSALTCSRYGLMAWQVGCYFGSPVAIAGVRLAPRAASAILTLCYFGVTLKVMAPSIPWFTIWASPRWRLDI